MKRWGKWGLFTLAICAALATASRWVVRHHSAETLAAEPAQANQYAALFAGALPHLEEALGAKLDFTPHFQAITAAELQAKPNYDLEEYIRWHFPSLRGETLTKTRQIARRVVGSATVAHYVERANVIVVAAENLPRIAAWDEELAAANSEAFLQLELVHEVVRWHLDCHWQLGKLRGGCRDAEEFAALQTVIEGRAQAVTQQVAAKLGSDAFFHLLADRYLHVADENPDPSIKAVSQTALRERYQACFQGRAFFQGLDELGVRDAEEQVFTHLPRQMTVMAVPARWVKAVRNNQPDLAAVLEPLETMLPATAWRPMQQTWTPEMLGQVADMLGGSKERAENIGKNWYEGRSVIWTNRAQPGRHVALTAIRHDDESGARAYFSFALELQRKQDALAPGTCGPVVQVIESNSTGVQIEGFDEAARNEKRIAIGGGDPIPVSMLLARVGNLVVECTMHGQEADLALAKRLAQEVGRTARPKASLTIKS